MTRGHQSGARLGVRVERANGGAMALTVFCPRRLGSVEIDTCAACEHCHGLSVDPTGRETFLMCDAEPALRLDPERHAAVDERSFAQGLVADIMTSRVVTVRPETSVETVVGVLLERGISGVPVVDDDGRPVGMVSKTDLLRELDDAGDDLEVEPLRVRSEGGFDVVLGPGFHAERIARATAGEVMAPVAFTLPATATIAQASALMALDGVHRVPIVDSAGRVIGIVSSLDVLGWVSRAAGYVVPRRA